MKAPMPAGKQPGDTNSTILLKRYRQRPVSEDSQIQKRSDCRPVKIWLAGGRPAKEREGRIEIGNQDRGGLQPTFDFRRPVIKNSFGEPTHLRSRAEVIAEQLQRNTMTLRREEMTGIPGRHDFTGKSAFSSPGGEFGSIEYQAPPIRSVWGGDVRGSYEDAPMIFNFPHMVYRRAISGQLQAPEMGHEGMKRKFSEDSVDTLPSARSTREGLAQLPMDRITDEVMRQIDHRLQVWRERTGNI